MPPWTLWRLMPQVWAASGLTPGPLLGPYVLRARRVLERFTDYRGNVVHLSCGHFLPDRPPRVAPRRFCEPCRLTGRGGEVPALHDIRCGCYYCMGLPDPRRRRRP